jgi:small subunit ribosomal protein S9
MAEVIEQTQEQEQTTEPQAAPLAVVAGSTKPYYGTGRRKSSVARVFLRPGSGGARVNGRELSDYFPTATMRQLIVQPLEAVELNGRFDITATVRGGGPAGQAGAIRLGIARALLEYDVELRKKLKKLGFLSRDARIHERKKYGQKGARKRFQFSKR